MDIMFPSDGKVVGSIPAGSAKNPVHASGRDFYLLPFHSSLFTKNIRTGFLEVISNSE